jgi:hypothetical protein
MLDIYTVRHREPPAARTQRPIEAGEAGMNPWLLWRPDGPRERELLSVAELAECACPDLCNRDHVNE